MCSTFLPGLVRRLKPLLAPLSLLDTCACVGASLSLNAAAARSSMGAMVLLPASICCPAKSACALMLQASVTDAAVAALDIHPLLLLKWLSQSHCSQSAIACQACMLTWTYCMLNCCELVSIVKTTNESGFITSPCDLCSVQIGTFHSCHIACKWLLDATQVLLFHSLAFVVGYFLTHSSVSGPDRVPVARCISLETGMQVQLPSTCFHLNTRTVSQCQMPCCCASLLHVTQSAGCKSCVCSQ